MSGDDLKARAAAMPVQSGSGYASIRRLILDGVLHSPRDSRELARSVAEQDGNRLKTIHVHTYMRKFMEAGIIRAVRPSDSRVNHYVLASMSRADALRAVGKERRTLAVEGELFSARLVGRLAPKFSTELAELRANFGQCGNATAFLLRKILEKLLLIVFGKLGRISVIEDKSRPSGWKGLEQMIQLAAQEKVAGVPLLLPRTANELRGTKFLGDTAAHNPFVDVDMSTIIPQMPFVITALDELSRYL